MNIHYVVPPKGVTFKSSADAVAAFESGQVWRLVGTGLAIAGELHNVVKASGEARFSECEPVRTPEGEIVSGPGKVFLMEWAPGRRIFKQYRPTGFEGAVSFNYGTGRQVALRDERTTKSPEVRREERAVTQEGRLLRAEMKEHGSWATGSGLAFTPVLPNRRMDLDPFPMLVWDRSRSTPVSRDKLFDPDPSIRTPGDRELERWYWSSQHRAYNQHAADAQAYRGGVSDDTMDPEVMYFPKVI